jgi:hypothetical protein
VDIESVVPGSPGERAGFRPGDRVTAWRRAAAFPASPFAAAGPITSPFDLERVLREEAPRGLLELRGVRAGRPFRLELAVGISLEAAGLQSAPLLAPGPLAPFLAGRSAGGRGDAEGGAESLRLAARLAFAMGDGDGGLWLLRERARVFEAARLFAAADSAYREAADVSALRARPLEAAALRVEWAQSLDRRVLWTEAEEVLAEAERLPGLAASPLNQIGRASCRERVS